MGKLTFGVLFVRLYKTTEDPRRPSRRVTYWMPAPPSTPQSTSEGTSVTSVIWLSCVLNVQFIYLCCHIFLIFFNIVHLIVLSINLCYLIMFFTYFYPVILVKLMCVYCAYILCFRITLFHLNTVIDVHIFNICKKTFHSM